MTAAVVAIEPVIAAHASWRYIASKARRDLECLAEAKVWYPTFRRKVVNMKRRYGKMYPHMTIFDWCCFVAILSARVSVKQNLDTADALAKHGPAVITDRSLLQRGDKLSSTGEFLNKAARILLGEKGEDVLVYRGAEKTWNFARDIYFAGKHRNSCTLDVHMLVAALWPKKSVSTLEYECLSYGLVKLAEELGMTVMELQALIWRYIRGKSA